MSQIIKGIIGVVEIVAGVLLEGTPLAPLAPFLIGMGVSTPMAAFDPNNWGKRQ